MSKININFFERNEVMNIFHTTIFSKKKKQKTKKNKKENNISKITAKNNI